MLYTKLLSLWIVLVLQGDGIACYELTMLPDELTVGEESMIVTVRCQADVALTGCQFSWLDRDGHPGPVVEVGGDDEFTPYYRDSWLTGYTYTGRGLDAGDCGIALTVRAYLKWMVGCRVHTDQGGWRYAWMDLTSRGDKQLATTVDLNEAVVLPNDKLRFVVKSPEPLGRCSFFVPGVVSGLYFDQGVQSQDSAGRHRYTGAGVRTGDCGLELLNVSEGDNGLVRCYLENTAKTAYTWRFMAIVVANRPTEPVLDVVYEGLRATATCSVYGSRPAPTFTWLLGDTILRQDAHDDSPGSRGDEWSWPWMKRTVVQRLTLEVTPSDLGQELRCSVSHIALDQPLEASTTISNSDADYYVYSTTATAYHPALTDQTDIEHNKNDASNSSVVKVNASNTSTSKRAVKNADEPANSEVATLLLEAARSQSRADLARAREAELSLLLAKRRARLEEESAREAVTSYVAHRRVEEARTLEAELAVVAMRSHAQAEEARAKAEEARAKAEEDRALNANEQLQFERESRHEIRKQLYNPESPDQDPAQDHAQDPTQDTA